MFRFIGARANAGGGAGSTVIEHDFDVNGETGWTDAVGGYTVNGIRLQKNSGGGSDDLTIWTGVDMPLDNFAFSIVPDAALLNGGPYLQGTGAGGGYGNPRIMWALSANLYENGTSDGNFSAGHQAGDRVELEKRGRVLRARTYVGDPFVTDNWEDLRFERTRLINVSFVDLDMRPGVTTWDAATGFSKPRLRVLGEATA